MHTEAFAWVSRYRTREPVAVLDIGARNINGSVRPLFAKADPYRTLDIAPGDDVDIVADAADWSPDREYDVVVCCEVFEHTPRWPEICKTAFSALRPAGLFVATMAGPGRPEHSAVDGGPLHPGEYYGNVSPDELRGTLTGLGFVDVVVNRQASPADVRCAARRPSQEEKWHGSRRDT
jgi:hypothetical protein